MTALPDYEEPTVDDDGGPSLTQEQRGAWESVVTNGWKLSAMISHGLSESGSSSNPELRVLEALDREPRMRISDIAAATHIQMSTVSRQITRLVDQGLVERVDVVARDDARHRWVRLSEAGIQQLHALVERRDAMVCQYVVSVLGEEDFLTLGRLFAKVGESAGQCPREAELSE